MTRHPHRPRSREHRKRLPDTLPPEDFSVLDEDLLLREPPAPGRRDRQGGEGRQTPSAPVAQTRKDGVRSARRPHDADAVGSQRLPRQAVARRAVPESTRTEGRRREASARTRWQASSLLLPEPDAALRQGLDLLGAALARVRPLTAAHARQLPQDVAALSRLLTVERAQLHHPYWASPALTSAYLYYFLPWNVLRQARLLAALPLPDPRLWLEQGRRPLLLDMGSGPLSLPLALWLARPDWRGLPLEVLALDASSQPLELGRQLLNALAGELHEPVWAVRTLRGPLAQAARQAARCLGPHQSFRAAGRDAPALWLATAANVLNELLSGGAAGRAARKERPDDWTAAETDGMADNERDAREDSVFGQRLETVLDGLEEVLELADAALPASLLVIEPGTRLGGTTVMRLRAAALERGLVPLTPCTHAADCPLERGRSGRGWCHVTFDCAGAPDWLNQLAEAAGLAKSSLSLAPLLLSPAAETLQDGLDARHEESGGGLGRAALRVLSAPFDVPGLPGRARYACGVGGLALLGDAGELPSGALVEADIPEQPRFDRRSGAILLLPGGEGAAEAAHRAPGPAQGASRGRATTFDLPRQRDHRRPHSGQDRDGERTGGDSRRRGERRGQARGEQCGQACCPEGQERERGGQRPNGRRTSPRGRHAPAEQASRKARGDRRH